MLTLAQALIALDDLKDTGRVSITSLMELAAQVSLDTAPTFTQGSVTLLYSGTINGVSSTDYIGKMIEQGADIRVIDKTNVGQFLGDGEFLRAWESAGGTDAQLLPALMALGHRPRLALSPTLWVRCGFLDLAPPRTLFLS